MLYKKEIIYPWFLECCEYTTDKFWKNIFEDLSYGISPYGTYIFKNFLCFKTEQTKVLFTYKLERKPPKQLYESLYDILTNKLGLLSKYDKIKKRVKFKNIQQDMKDSRTDWNSIRKKNIKDNLIEQYVIRMKKTHNLTLKKTKMLLSEIFIRLVFKNIKQTDIIFEDGRIKYIIGLEFKNKDFIFHNTDFNTDFNTDKNIRQINKKTMSDQWIKYIKDIKKSIN